MKVFKVLGWMFLGIVSLLGAIVGNGFRLAGTPALHGLQNEELIMRVVKGPVLLWVGAVVLLLTALGCAKARVRWQEEKAKRQAVAAQAKQAEAIAQQERIRTLGVQVICANLITPNFDGVRALEWYLPQLLQTDPVAPAPKAQWAPITNTGHEMPNWMFTEGYIEETLLPFRFYYLTGGFMYEGFKPEKEGTVFITGANLLKEPGTVNFGRIPDPKNPGGEWLDDLRTKPAYEHIEYNTNGCWSAYFAKTYDHLKIQHVFWQFGGATAGFRSLTEAFAYLEAHPKEVVWFIASDAPNAPKDEQSNEAGVLFLLAHPDFETGRQALGIIHRPVAVPVEKGSGPSQRVQHLKSAIVEACSRGSADVQHLSYLLHDAGRESHAIGQIGQAMTELAPDFDYLKQTISLPAWLGDLRATTTHYHLLVGLWAAHSTNKPALVVGLQDDEALHAVTITPPKGHVPPDPKRDADKLFPKARRKSDFSRPWWGKPGRSQGVATQPEPEKDKRLPLGTQRQTGQACPQTGIWQAAHGDKMARRPLYQREGERLISTVTRRLRNGFRLEAEDTTWTLVAYGEEKEEAPLPFSEIKQG